VEQIKVSCLKMNSQFTTSLVDTLYLIKGLGKEALNLKKIILPSFLDLECLNFDQSHYIKVQEIDRNLVHLPSLTSLQTKKLAFDSMSNFFYKEFFKSRFGQLLVKNTKVIQFQKSPDFDMTVRQIEDGHKSYGLTLVIPHKILKVVMKQLENPAYDTFMETYQVICKDFSKEIKQKTFETFLQVKKLNKISYWDNTGRQVCWFKKDRENKYLEKMYID
jgi:hypothetical protein